MVSATNDIVYTGVWTNWSKGKVLGWTLTTTSRNGAILIAFLALYITYVSTRIWRILCFCLHQHYSTKTAGSAFHQQSQITLRNADNAPSALLIWMKMAWSWRKSADKAYRRIFFLVALAIFTISWTAVAGIYSSRIASFTGDEVRLTGEYCGYYLDDGPLDVTYARQS
jgi:hypothetical protein